MPEHLPADSPGRAATRRALYLAVSVLGATSCMPFLEKLSESPMPSYFYETALMATADPILEEPSGADFGLTGNWVQANSGKDSAHVTITREERDTTRYTSRFSRRERRFVSPFTAARLDDKTAYLLLQHEWPRLGRDIQYFYSYAIVEQDRMQEWVILAPGVIERLAIHRIPYWAVREDSVTIVRADPARLLELFREYPADLSDAYQDYRRVNGATAAGR